MLNFVEMYLYYLEQFYKMKNLPDNLKLLPGHDYLENNLRFLDSIITDGNDFASDIKNFLTDCKSSELSEIKDIGFEKNTILF